MRYAWLSTVVGLVTWAVVPCAWADDFRIETKVYSGKNNKTKVSENTTLFQSGYVYDYLADPPRVAVFDQPHGRFIVLDPKRKVKAEVKTDDVLKWAEAFLDVCSKSSHSLKKFAADPDFKVEFSDSGVLALESPEVSYRLETMPANTPEAAEQYHEFCDWYARFNGMANLNSPPPFIRMAVNKELADRGLVPTEVNLSFTSPATTMRSEHKITWRLLPKDDERIADTAKQLATFKLIDFQEFEPPATAGKSGKRR